jgi:RecA-family ATPase
MEIKFNVKKSVSIAEFLKKYREENSQDKVEDAQETSFPEQVIRRAQSLGSVITAHENLLPPPILIRGIKVGSIGFVFGVPKSGKTTYTEHLLFSIAAGRTEFNGYALNSPSKVCLFVSYEENTWGRNERNQKQLNEFTLEEQESIKQNLIVSNQEMPRFVTDEEHWVALEEEIQFYKPGIVVIDSLSRLTLEDNGSEEVARRIMKRLREICTRFECTVVIRRLMFSVSGFTHIGNSDALVFL